MAVPASIPLADLSELSDKTVFVLDHTQYFSISCENQLDLDFGKVKASAGGALPLPPISKSLWTCSVESSVEYCRIAWDLFPTGKLIRFVVSDANAHIVNTWSTSTQNLSHVMNAMAMVGSPQRIAQQSAEYSVIHGLRAAVEAIAEPTEEQRRQTIAHSAANTTSPTAPNKHPNQGRVICITSARDNSSMHSLEDIFHTVMLQQNTLSKGRSDLLNIDRCHLVIINVYPANIVSMVTNREPQEITSAATFLRSEIHSVTAADIPGLLTHLILPHFDLASTTVTGIPMKEEQNASSSANYDVEIFHASKAHSVILGTELQLPTSIKDGSKYETVTLKWCTPRGLGASDMQPCLAQHRVTPIDVTSRPSSCLINFLLNGRSVLLEMPRNTGGKLTSHLLSAHGGEIFIHTLNISRSCLEDPPSVLEGIGGRVTDYRIPDFGALMQQHRLVPLKTDHPADENLQRTRSRYQRRTRYWPLTLSTTVLFNAKQFVEPILTLTSKDKMTADMVLMCQQNMFNLLALESRHEPLNLPVGHQLKGVKKDKLYRLLFAELATVLSAGGTTPEHKTVLHSVLAHCRLNPADATLASDKMEVDAVVREMEDPAKRTITLHKTQTDSPMSPPHSICLNDATGRTKNPFGASKGKSLLDVFTAAERALSQKRVDFSGRLCTPPGQVAKLYPNLGLKDVNARSAAGENEGK